MNFDNAYQRECRCPTCRAAQPWQDECRRCGTDLSDLRALAWESEQLMLRFPELLKANRVEEAKTILQRLNAIAPTPLVETLLTFFNRYGSRERSAAQ